MDEKVFVRTVRQEKINWQPGYITKIISPMTYLVKVEGRTRFVHVDHLRSNLTVEEEEEVLIIPKVKEPNIVQRKETTVESPKKDHQSPPQSRQSSPRLSITRSPVQNKPSSPKRSMLANETSQTTEDVRRSNRARKAPDKLNL